LAPRRIAANRRLALFRGADDEQLQNAGELRTYQLSSPETALQAPADVAFTWSDGHLEVTRHFRFDSIHM